MPLIPVIIKHQGKKYDIDLDPEATGETFKYQLYSLTNVEPERQKLLVKGGQLKDDAPLSSLNAKKGQVFMLMGVPSTGPDAKFERPSEKIKFLEDMTEAEVAQQEGAIPAGLQNLGNTCYLNSALQTLKAIPELSDALQTYKENGNSGASNSTLLGGLNFGSSLDMTAALRDLYKQMSETQEGFPPLLLLNSLRQSYPQFAEKAKDGRGFAQQDAEEAWSIIVQTLRTKLKGNGEGSSSATRGEGWVDSYLAGVFDQELTCDEGEAAEEPQRSQEVFFKLNCNIPKEVNHMTEGIRIALNESIEKQSPTLGRSATYTRASRISRLPKWLPVHFVRFFWKNDVKKKAKILKKVTFPMEFDVVEFCTEELKRKLIPVRDRIREVRKEEEDVERAKKRQKRIKAEQADNAAIGITDEPLAKKKEKEKAAANSTIKQEKKEEVEVFKTDAEIEAERAEKILAAKRDLVAAVDANLAADVSSNQTGLYELRGVVTHQGSSADSGHYTAYVKKAPKKRPDGSHGEEDGKWWWFNDDKVSEVDAEKIETLSGGGESHSALILLYRAVALPTQESLDEEEKKLKAGAASTAVKSEPKIKTEA